MPMGNGQYTYREKGNYHASKAKQLGYADLQSFNNSPEGKTFQLYIHNKNLSYRRNK